MNLLQHHPGLCALNDSMVIGRGKSDDFGDSQLGNGVWVCAGEPSGVVQ